MTGPHPMTGPRPSGAGQRRGVASLPTGFALSALALIAACQSPTEPERHFEILSPTSDSVSVLPGGSVRFEVRVDPGFTVEYLVDDRLSQSGPIFIFEPDGPAHTVTTVVRSTSPAATVLEKDFVVVVEVPGNLPPEIVSLTATNGLEAQRDTVRASTIVSDPDGSVQNITVDFGDGTPPATQNSKATTFETKHVYAGPGLYWVKATVTDSVQISSSDSTQITVVPPNQLPVGTLTVNGPQEGNAPVQVTLVPAGLDPDGTIVKWEIDPEGDGDFETIQPFEQVPVSYPFSENAYRPALKLTDDDGDSAIIESADVIKVFRSISAVQSTTQAFGNPVLSANGRVFIWADGQDHLTINVDVRDPQGNPLSDVPVRITSQRPLLQAGDASNLGPSVNLNPGAVVNTGGDGRATAFLTSRTSTRVEAVPEIASIPFDLRLEASRGHGEWVELDPIAGIETETLVDGRVGIIVTSKLGGGGYCAGDTVEIRVKAVNRPNVPGGAGSAVGMYTEIRYGQFTNQVWFGARPGPAHANWRTDGSGEIVFRYVVQPHDDDAIIAAWVDGNRLNVIAAFNFKPGC